MALVRGIKLINIQTFVAERFGEAAWSALCEGAGVGQEVLPDPSRADSWYDAEIHRSLLHTLWSYHDDRSYRLLHLLGRYESDIDLAGAYRWIPRIVSPQDAVRRLTVYWRRTHDTGEWSSVVRPGSVESTLRGWELLDRIECERVLGSLGRTLEHLGGRVSALDCELLGRDACVFRAAVTFAEPRPEEPAVLDDSDLFDVARELNQCEEPQQLAEAITGLLLALPSCRYASVLVAGPADAPLRRLTEQGDGERPERFVLETRGVVLGHIEACVGGSDRERVVRLAPWIAAAFERMALATRSDADVPEADPLSGRLRRARARWGLTPRQTEVLGLLAQGATNKEIAARLQCSEATVEIHVTHLLTKAEADNRTVLAARFWSQM